jgi:FkbM family methyltransferase
MSEQSTETKFSAKFLSGLNLEAKTVFDIGVYNGTPELYRAFSDRKLVLFDPLPETPQKLQARYRNRYEFDFHAVALGSADSTLELKIVGGRSSLLEPIKLDKNYVENHSGNISVPVRRLDDVIAERNYAKPYGMKIDTEGFEMQVLKGAPKTLANTEFIIAEVSVRQRFKESYTFSEIVAFLAKRGLEFFAVLNDQPMVQQRFYDCLFIRKTHPIMTGL